MDQPHHLASIFRSTIEKLSKENFLTTLGCSPFPHACCDDASLPLAAYLTDNGYFRATRVHRINHGNKEELKSHVWLNYSGLIIDITTDQFEISRVAPIYVGKKSELHESFEIESQEVADFREKLANDTTWLSHFTHDYELILSRLPP